MALTLTPLRCGVCRARWISEGAMVDNSHFLRDIDEGGGIRRGRSMFDWALSREGARWLVSRSVVVPRTPRLMGGAVGVRRRATSLEMDATGPVDRRRQLQPVCGRFCTRRQGRGSSVLQSSRPVRPKDEVGVAGRLCCLCPVARTGSTQRNRLRGRSTLAGRRRVAGGAGGACSGRRRGVTPAVDESGTVTRRADTL
jgi:hypothetical protein